MSEAMFPDEERKRSQTAGFSFDRAEYDELDVDYDEPHRRERPPGPWSHEQRSRELMGTRSRYGRKRKNRSSQGGRGQGHD
ncbi:MAG: hypothetical protein KDA42_01185 [Planctomycetales bacterium]|nr:hypothetical protein [Planctomycetales bacterium]